MNTETVYKYNTVTFDTHTKTMRTRCQYSMVLKLYGRLGQFANMWTKKAHKVINNRSNVLFQLKNAYLTVLNVFLATI